MNIPEIDDVVEALRGVLETCSECNCDTEDQSYHADSCGASMEVRLQVTEDDWELHYGDSGYDQDHIGHWGSATVAGYDDDSVIERAAEQLILQVEESLAEEEEWVV